MTLTEPSARVQGFDGEQLGDDGFLRHRVHELGIDDEESVDGVVLVGVEHDLDRTEQIFDVRTIAETAHTREDRKTQTSEESGRLVAEQTEVDVGALPLPLAHQHERALEHVRIERAAKTAVARHDDDADRFGFAFGQERMAIVGVRLVEMPDDDADLFGIGTRQAHAILSAAHLARRDHLHGLGDLLSAFDTRDLGAYFLCAGHVSRRP